MIINHNMASLNTYNKLSANNAATKGSLEKLSSGLRINKAGDDAAGLAISEKMRGQIRGLDQASRNAQDSISLIQTAEGGLSETQSILQRMRELAVQSSNDTATDSDRNQMQKEVTALKTEIDRIASTTEFNTKKLLNGSLTAASTAQATKENSNQFKEAVIAATAGTSVGGTGLVVSSAVAAKAGTAATVTGTTAIASSVTITAATNDMFKLNVNGAATSADITIAAGTYDRAGFLDAVNNALATYNTGKTADLQVSASYTSDYKLQFSTKITGAGTAITTAAGTSDAIATMGMTTTNTTAGTTTVNGVTSAASRIVTGANDQFKLTVDGGSAQTLTLSAGSYATTQDLVNEVNTQINANVALSGKVTASLATDGSNKVIFTSASTGSTSNVTVADPTTVAQSALSALGYDGKATTLTSITVNNTDAGALSLEATAKAQFTLQIGNKTVAGIDISVATNAGNGVDAKATQDAIIKALQTKLDSSFGTGAVTVAANGSKINLVNNTDSKVFTVSATGTTGLFANGSATVGAVAANTVTAGSDATGGILSNSTKLVNLTDTDGNKLNLAAGNVIEISGSQNGTGFSSKYTVTANSTVSDLINQMKSVTGLSTATISLDLTKGQFNITGVTGSANDISNLSLTAQNSATDSTAVGDFNKVFQTFKVTQEAKDTKSDASLTMHIGANQGQTMNIDINDMGTKALRLVKIDISSQDGAETAISVINNALEAVSDERSKLGAFQNRLEHTITNLGTSSENITAAESRIRDVDMAKEMMNFQKNNILSQAAQAMLAQANQQPQGVLQLLR